MTAHLRLSPLRGSEDADRLAATLAPGYFGKEDVPRQILEQTRSFLAANPRPDPWGSYLAWDGDAVVGVWAYKSPRAARARSRSPTAPSPPTRVAATRRA